VPAGCAGGVLLTRTDRPFSGHKPARPVTTHQAKGGCGMWRLCLSTFIAIVLIAGQVQLAHAQKRVALVIGNSGYEHTPKLRNPKNDATDVAANLRMKGFDVIEALDLENYLVPIDASLSSAAALELEAVRVDVVQRVMESRSKTSILFLDACRDNPLARNLASAMGTRSVEIGRGLAAIESGVGTLISFATQPGNVALDGVGRNSPFAGALLKHLGTSNDDLSSILIDVRNDVMRVTESRQVPWEHSALRGRFYFGGGPANAFGGSEGMRDASRELTPIDKASLQSSNWKITREGSPCTSPTYTVFITVSNSMISGRAGAGFVEGNINAAGRIKFSHPAAAPKGSVVHYVGQLAKNSGTGTFGGAGRCAGTFSATRQ